MKQINTLFTVFAVALMLPAIVPALHAQTTGKDGSLAGRLSYHVHLLAADSLDGRSLGARGRDVATTYIASQFEEAGLRPFQNGSYLQPFQIRQGIVNLNAVNVIGIVDGSDPQLRKEYIVMGAHYDHIGFHPDKEGEERVFNGADDNASGVAMLIELARYFGRNPEKTARTLIFIAFDAEELGLKGSGHFIKNTGMEGADAIRMMFSMDMVGMYESNNGLNIKGIGSITGGRALAVNLSEKHNIRLKNTSHKSEYRTDTWPFVAAGIPSVHVFTGLKPSPYHKPHDTADKLEYEGMAKITTYMQELVSELSGSPAVEPVSAFGRPNKIQVGFMVNVGNSYHRYPDEFFHSKARFSPGAGLFAQVRFGKYVAIQPEILYYNNGSVMADGKFRRHSLMMPVNLQIGMSQYDGLLRVFSIAGMYGQYTFAGRLGDQELDLGGLHRDMEWGINLGAGMQMDRISISVICRRALNTVTTGGLNSYAASSIFTLGYSF